MEVKEGYKKYKALNDAFFLLINRKFSILRSILEGFYAGTKWL